MKTIRRDLGCPGLQWVGPLQDLELDAGGFQVVENDKLEARLKSLRQLARELKTQCTIN
jgi:hypothetical protein